MEWKWNTDNYPCLLLRIQSHIARLSHGKEYVRLLHMVFTLSSVYFSSVFIPGWLLHGRLIFIPSLHIFLD